MPQDHLQMPSCDICNKKMQFVEGDVIFGEKWYHKDCLPQKLSINKMFKVNAKHTEG
jgi:hypothetical protein